MKDMAEEEVRIMQGQGDRGECDLVEQGDPGEQVDSTPEVFLNYSEESANAMKAAMRELSKELEAGNLKFREMDTVGLKYCVYMEYRGYRANVEYDDRDKILVGTVIGIKDKLSFHGRSTEEMVFSFSHCIDEYLDLCEEIGKQAE